MENQPCFTIMLVAAVLFSGPLYSAVKVLKDTRYVYNEQHHLINKIQLTQAQFPKIEKKRKIAFHTPVEGKITQNAEGVISIPISMSPIHLSPKGFESLKNSSWGWSKDTILGPFLDSSTRNWVSLPSGESGQLDFNLLYVAYRMLWEYYAGYCHQETSGYYVPSVFPAGYLHYKVLSPVRVKTYTSTANATNRRDVAIKVKKNIALTYETIESESRSEVLINSEEWHASVSVTAKAGLPDIAEVGTTVETGIAFNFTTQKGTEKTKSKAYSFTDHIEVEADLMPHQTIRFMGVAETYDVPMTYEVPIRDALGGNIYAFDGKACHVVPLVNTHISAKSGKISSGVINSYAVNTALLVS